jgi:lipopolysaccharide/colanic/teichoic acid biosynthesis glycosyltransferase
MTPSDLSRARDTIERLVAAGALIALAPLLAIVSILVKVTSKGPILYQSEMLGKNARIFKMKKIRSMENGAVQLLTQDDKTVVTDNDPRLTPIGKYLRVGIDEIPQLVNILNGDMAFVGPRPDPAWVLPRYTPLIRERLRVKPGITGLSQVLDGRGQRQAVVYFLDHYYVEHHSLGMDMAIMALTIPYVVGVRFPGEYIFTKVLEEAAEHAGKYKLLPPGDCPQPIYIEGAAMQDLVSGCRKRREKEEGRA